MSLSQHQRTQKGTFRRERGDAKVSNLKKEYPELEGINGNTKLSTLRENLGVTSLSKVLQVLREGK